MAGTLGSTTGPLAVNGTGIFDIGATSQTVGAVTIAGGTIQDGTLTGTSYTSTGGTVSASLGGTGSLTASSGTLTLSGTNSYSSGTTISGGTLQFTQTAAMPASGTVSVASGATLAVNAGGTGEFTNATSGTGSIGGLLNGVGGQGAGVTFASGSSLGIDTTNAGGSLTYAGNITNSSLGITKLGTGSLMLSGTNSYSGGNIVAPARCRSAAAAHSVRQSGALTVNAAGTVDLGATSQSIGAVMIAGGTIQDGTLTGTSYTSTGGTVSASLGGTGSLTASSGKLTLSGTNTYTGGTTVNSGTLQFGDGTARNGSVAGNIMNNSSLAFANPNAQTYSGAISGGGNVTKSGAGYLQLTSDNAIPAV